jgi:drug/metabolite transporter (DMT)-like permease
MLWVFLALGSAFSMATADALTKKFFSDFSASEMAYVRLFYGAPWLIVPFLLSPTPNAPASIWLVVVAMLPLEILALLLYMRAIKVSPLSLSIPFLAFTPVWMILSAWLILGELPNAHGAAGIVVVAAGAYVLNLGGGNVGLLGPVKAVFREPGSRLMLLVSLIYAITAAVGKKLVLAFGPTYQGSMYFLLLTAVLWPILRGTGRVSVERLISRPGRGLMVGFCFFGVVLFHVWAISMAPAAYMVAIKRLSFVFSVLYGRILLKETQFSKRLAGAAIMFAGMVLITIWG